MEDLALNQEGDGVPRQVQTRDKASEILQDESLFSVKIDRNS